MVDKIDPQAASLPKNLGSFGAPKGQGTDFEALLRQQNSVKQEISEKGMVKYAADIQQEKLEAEIREKILASMGLSEADLAKMPASQRAMIEKTVQEAIQQEMQARMEEKAQENDKKIGVSVPLVAGLSG